MIRNVMKEYLGDEYSDNAVINFCKYYIKNNSEHYKQKYDAWRAINDLDCICYNGDLNADFLFSWWNPIKWVVDYLNKGKNIIIYKNDTKHGDKFYYQKCLINKTEDLLPSKLSIVKKLYKFLELCEQNCNYILLPKRDMNKERTLKIEGISLNDFVPAMLYYVFEKDVFGKYFNNSFTAIDWIYREGLQFGFYDEKICQENVICICDNRKPTNTNWLNCDEKDCEQNIEQALDYMILFLERRKEWLISKQKIN